MGAYLLPYGSVISNSLDNVDLADALPETRDASTKFLRAGERTEYLKANASNPSPYLIYVAKDSYTIAILGLDEAGEYTRLLHLFHTAVGRSSGQTRAGTYTLTSRERWHTWGSGSYSPYATKHSGGLWFHGPIFGSKATRPLNVRSYNQIGTKATSGCMRTYTSVAAWIYNNCPDGTTVIIANDSKYVSSPRSQIAATQGYDPTDPDIEIR